MNDVDRALQLRQEIKAKKQELAALCAKMVTGEAGLIGEHTYATIRRQVLIHPLPEAAQAGVQPVPPNSAAEYYAHAMPAAPNTQNASNGRVQPARQPWG